MTTEATVTPPNMGKLAKIGLAVLLVGTLIVVIVVACKVAKNSRIHRENEQLINEQLKRGAFTINPPAA